MFGHSRNDFSSEVFTNPPAEYRGAPFWSWNGDLEIDKLKKQIQVFKLMGFGGFFIHSRIGLRTEYLGKHFMDLVKECNEYAKELSMLTWLYDEDKWPSGFGGGRVSSNPEYAAKFLLFSKVRYEDGFLDRKLAQNTRIPKNGYLSFLRCYQVELRGGRLVTYKVADRSAVGDNCWYAYQVTTDCSSWFNNTPYVDTLNADAVQRFIDVTHEQYKEALGKEFGVTIPAIFTDEPCFYPQENLDEIAQSDTAIAYTSSFDEKFLSKYGIGFLDSLPELFWNCADGTLPRLRYQYFELIASLFAESYAGSLGKWCGQHGLMLTGHLLFENLLDSQTRVVGEVMRSLKHFKLPGIDMLADRHEYVTAKQAQSIANQYQRIGTSSELYGVTNWDFDFRGHKHQGDWQAAMGVVVRIPHLAWMTMKGEAKRDYPAPIDQHSPWHAKYKTMEDYFSRVNYVLTRGKNACRIAVIHPIESYWMLMGPIKETAGQRKRLEENFQSVTEWLLFNLLDFDLVSESLLPELYGGSGQGCIHVGAMSYDVVVVPDLVNIRGSTLKYLIEFAKSGGEVIFTGSVPQYVDGVLSGDPAGFARDCIQTGIDKWAIIDALEKYRSVEIVDENNQRSERLLYQLRSEQDCQWLFIAHGKKDNRLKLSHWVSNIGSEQFEVSVRGKWGVEKYDPFTGAAEQYPSEYAQNNMTMLTITVSAHDSFLFRLSERDTLTGISKQGNSPGKPLADKYFPSVVNYELGEPNVLVLDLAEYQLDNQEWEDVEEVLKIDEAVRKRLGYPLRTESFPQPWLENGNSQSGEKPSHSLKLRYVIDSQVEIGNVALGFEPSNWGTRITWNNETIDTKTTEYFVDQDIHKINLGALRTGQNILVMETLFDRKTDVEASYLIGDFAVYLTGSRAQLRPLPEQVGFGDLTVQGFPFYGGNFHYKCEIETLGSFVEIMVPEYNGALLTIQKGTVSKDVFMEPYSVTFPSEHNGKSQVMITCFGTRINTFGQFHNSNRKETYFGPKSWRTKGSEWSYNYYPRKFGVLTAPIAKYYL